MTDANLILGEGDAVFVQVRKMGFGLLALGGAFTAIFLALASAANAAAPTYNLQGTWTSGNLNSEGARDPQNGIVSITQPGSTA